jgi:CBS domain
MVANRQRASRPNSFFGNGGDCYRRPIRDVSEREVRVIAWRRTGGRTDMGRTYDAIDDTLAEFIRAQHVFFVASAPFARDGHVNVSPKGLDSLRVLGPRKAAYLDLLRERGIHHLPVVRQGRLVGIISPVDVLRYFVNHVLPKPPEAG